MKSAICHEFPSPYLLEGQKDAEIFKNAEFF